MIGKERVFVATLIALAAGSLLAAVTSSIAVLIVARVIQGVAGGMVPVAFGSSGTSSRPRRWPGPSAPWPP